MLTGALCRLRQYREDDARTLVRLADDFEVARWMSQRFPHPYTIDAARAWLAKAVLEAPVDNFAIEVDGALAGGAGVHPHTGERHGVAEFGYWLARAYWGRGIATEAAQLVTAYGHRQRQLRRLEAHILAPNIASARVLEKSGFIREAVLRQAYSERDGTVVDGALYASLTAVGDAVFSP
jgi:RimJ/RimL family protein N-acetyltransferase